LYQICEFLVLNITGWTLVGRHSHYFEPRIVILLSDCIANNITDGMFDGAGLMDHT